jgi:hypothetical protein
MNCKPGDLAVVVRAVSTPEMIGRYVICKRLAVGEEPIDGQSWQRLYRPDPVWIVEVAGADPIPWGSKMVRRRAINDAFLRPIRDPGDDAKDEMLRPLPIKEVA